MVPLPEQLQSAKRVGQGTRVPNNTRRWDVIRMNLSDEYDFSTKLTTHVKLLVTSESKCAAVLLQIGSWILKISFVRSDRRDELVDGIEFNRGDELGAQQTRKMLTPLPTPCTLHPAPYTLHPTPNTQYPTPYTQHPGLR